MEAKLRCMSEDERLRRRLFSVVGKWKDHHVLKILDSTYKPEEEQSLHNWNGEVDAESEDKEIKVFVDGWWELDSDAEAISPESWLTIMYATEPVILVSQVSLLSSPWLVY
ncbi:hypothetical protein ACFX19_002673 [Malus domestica]